MGQGRKDSEPGRAECSRGFWVNTVEQHVAPLAVWWVNKELERVVSDEKWVEGLAAAAIARLVQYILNL